MFAAGVSNLLTGSDTHRIGLSDYRLHTLEEGQVQLDYKDYRDGAKHKSLTLSGEELIRRFLLHVLPRGFMRVRHYGFLANRCRAQRLSVIRAAIEEQRETTLASAVDVADAPFAGYPCPKCRKGWLRIIEELAPQRQRLEGG
jgi:hypothetical protein